MNLVVAAILALCMTVIGVALIKNDTSTRYQREACQKAGGVWTYKRPEYDAIVCMKPEALIQ